MRRAQAVFMLALSIAAGVILAQSSLQITQAEWPTLLVLAIVFIFSDFFELVDLGGGGLSFAAGGLLGALLIGGPHVAIWAAALGVLVESLIKSGLLINLLFNLAQFVVSGWLAFQAYVLLGGAWGPAFDHPGQVLLLSVIFMLTNGVLYATTLHTMGRMNGLVALRLILSLNSARAYMITTSMGILFGFAYLKGGALWAVAVAVVAYMLHSTLRRFFVTLEETRSQAQQLEAVLNATQGALIMTDREGLIKVANQQSGVLFGVQTEWLLGQPGTAIPELRRIRELEGPDPTGLQQVLKMARGPARYVQGYRAAVRNSQGDLQGYIQVLTDVSALKEAEESLRRLNVSMIKALAAAVDARDSYTHGHSARVSEYAVTIARRLGLPFADLERIGYSGLLHDIGKLGVADRVLNKRGPLTPDERALMMQHPLIGAEVLAKADVLIELLPGIRWHHEWVSGGGYPDGLVGESIPLDARIIGVADAFDAMTTDRQYRAKLSLEEALRRILNGAGVQFDASVATALVECATDGEIVMESRQAPGAEEPPPAETSGIRPVHGKELSIFYQLSREDYATLNLGTMLSRTLETLHQVIGGHIYMIYLRDSETGTLDLRSTVGLQEQDNPADKDRRLIEEALATGGPVVAQDIRELEGYHPAGHGTKSEVVIPLVTPQEVLGVMVVEAAMPDLFHRDDIYLLETLSQQICALVKLGRYHERLTHAASHDSLTGVFNDSYFYERLSEEVDRAGRLGCQASVAVIDVQGLKAMNDTYGHSVGDQALRSFGQALYELARPADVVARHGGDEFAVILPGTCTDDAAQEVRRLLAEVEERLTTGGLQLALTVGAWGVATYPVDGTRATELVAAADGSMYQGRQRVQEVGSENLAKQ